MTTIYGVNPRTGERMPGLAEETSPGEVAEIVRRAEEASHTTRLWSREFRADTLMSIAARIDDSRESLISVAAEETAFSLDKLGAELTRAADQFRFFASVVLEGSYLEAAIDHAQDGQPDLRRLLMPLGPVAVFGASNFPFAFSVLGGDTASALAGGNTVIIKAHPSHPATSRLSFQILREALRGTPGMVGLVHGTSAGAALITAPGVKAVGFTGSLVGGKALMDLIATRAEPIPFYGELSSINPVIISAGAGASRGAAIGRDLVASLTVGSGQLCTKPGVFLVPEGTVGDKIVAAARESIGQDRDLVLLNQTIFESFNGMRAGLEDVDLRAVLIGPRNDAAFGVSPILADAHIDDVDLGEIREVFGPFGYILRYDETGLGSAVTRIFEELPASLAVAIHTAPGEEDLAKRLAQLASGHAGRVVFDSFPTGVAVTWAQHHGGPWPATNSLHSSVGASSIRRFLRPVAFQNAPQSVLPSELRDEAETVPRRIDGILTLAKPKEKP